MSKLSGLCKTSDEHAACPQWLFDNTGKRFRCTCDCHIDPEVIIIDTPEDDQDYE